MCPLIGKEEESDGGRERGCTDGSFFLSVFVPPTSLYASFTLAGKKGGGGARTSVFSTLDPERNKKIGGKSRLCLNRAFPLHFFFLKSQLGGESGSRNWAGMAALEPPAAKKGERIISPFLAFESDLVRGDLKYGLDARHIFSFSTPPLARKKP